MKKSKALYLDYTLPIEKRVNDLVSRMSILEKISQLMNNAQSIPRLGVPEYDWWGEALHGVARAGRATVFPEPIGMAATFDTALIQRVGSAISDEARAKYYMAIKNNNRGQYCGLTFWSPNVNIFRDPRWGRGQETWGEDPVLTSHMGTAFVRGMQGNHPRYLKTAACAKHYAVHSGPEKVRSSFDARVSQKDLWETYLPAFEALVKAGVESVMGAYNRTNGEPCCGSKTLLADILRGKWGFNGHVVSDCGAIGFFDEKHKVTATPVESAALAVRMGCDLNCGCTYVHLKDAVSQGLITEKEIDIAVGNLMRTRMKLGMFDPPTLDPFRHLDSKVVLCDKHRSLAREAARKSVVLLRNKDGLLPLKKNLRSIFVVGPNAASVDALLGNYFGIADTLTTILEGISSHVSSGTAVYYKPAFLINRKPVNPVDWTVGEANASDVVVAVMGISPLMEGEEGESPETVNCGDRGEISLPENQKEYLRKLAACKKPVVLVLNAGSPLDITEFHDKFDAILYVWYPGMEGGNAVADVIFGDAAPSGKLPITFPKSIEQLPPFEDYSMENRTYRYIKEEPLYPFGFGLSYTKFVYGKLKLKSAKVKKGDAVTATVTVSNKGNTASDEVVQLYLSDVEASVRVPQYSLKAFSRVHLKPGQSKQVSFEITPAMMELVDNDGNRVLEPGEFKVTIGGSSPGKRSEELGAVKPATGVFTVI
jgi:beta-glucosidase